MGAVVPHRRPGRTAQPSERPFSAEGRWHRLQASRATSRPMSDGDRGWSRRPASAGSASAGAGAESAACPPQNQHPGSECRSHAREQKWGNRPPLATALDERQPMAAVAGLPLGVPPTHTDRVGWTSESSVQGDVDAARSVLSVATPVLSTMGELMRGSGRVVFVGTLLLIVGTLNIIYGIGSVGDAHALVGDQRIVFTNLHTYGWVLIILGVIQLTGGLSLLGGNTYGRVLGIIGRASGHSTRSRPSVGGTRGGHWACSPSASTSCTGSSSSAATRRRPSSTSGFSSQAPGPITEKATHIVQGRSA